MQLELDDLERETLSEALKSFLSELRTEVSHTDRLAYRERLRTQEHRLRQILDRLEAREPA